MRAIYAACPQACVEERLRDRGADVAGAADHQHAVAGPEVERTHLATTPSIIP